MDAFPLSWPAGWPRTPGAKQIRAKFSTKRFSTNACGQQIGVGEGVRRVLEQLRGFGVLDGDAIISTNLTLRGDGRARADQAEPSDKGVAVYWERPGEHGMKCMAIDIYDRVADNLAAVAATLEAMRAIERHGGAQILARAFTGFTALPAPGQTTTRGWREVLDLTDEATLDRARENYRRLAGIRHPDKGGTHAAMSELNAAWELAQQYFR